MFCAWVRLKRVKDPDDLLYPHYYHEVSGVQNVDEWIGRCTEIWMDAI
jgi:hypothetical protein